MTHLELNIQSSSKIFVFLPTFLVEDLAFTVGILLKALIIPFWNINQWQKEKYMSFVSSAISQKIFVGALQLSAEDTSSSFFNKF